MNYKKAWQEKKQALKNKMEENKSLVKKTALSLLALGLVTASVLTGDFKAFDRTANEKVPFKDVHGQWYEKEVKLLFDNDIVSGKTKELFKPNDKVKRSEIAKILSSTTDSLDIPLEKKREYKPFTDVKVNGWYEGHVKKLYEAGALNGYSNNQYRPDNEVTRAEMAVFLTNALAIEGTKNKPNFNDIKNDAWYKDHVEKLASVGIVTGSTQGGYLPENSITRAELSVMIARAIQFKGGIADKPSEKPVEKPSKPETKPEKPIEQPSKPSKPTEPETKPEQPKEPEKPVEKPVEKPKEDEVKEPEQKPEQPSKPTEPEKVVLKEVTIPFYDTYAKRDSLAINGAVIKLYKSKEEFEQGKKPVFEQSPKASLEDKDALNGFELKNIEEGTYYLVADNKALRIFGHTSYYYKDYEGTVTIHKDGKVDGRVELERIRKIPHSSDPDFLSPEKVKDSKEYFIKRINEYRKENGLKPIDFESNPDIPKIADGRAKHLTEYYGHQLPDGSTINGYFMTFDPKYQTSIAEAIVRGSVDVESAFKDWKNSSGHNKIMLSSDVNNWGYAFEHFGGIGINRDKNGTATYSLNIYGKLIN